jgi:histone-lysine N-methyltransferase SETD3
MNSENSSTEDYSKNEEKKETSSSHSNSKKGGNSTSVVNASGTNEESRESEMRGVHARCDVPPNTVCVSIPLECLITVEMGQATEIGQIILKSDLDLDAPKHIFLMIFLLYDRKVNGENSFFKPYYDILPGTLHNIPIFWTEEELKYLEGSYLLTQIADRNEAIAEDYHAICEVALELASIATLEEFKWARMCVCSRNFGLQINGHRTSALVPHADMLNHHRPRETKWTYDDDLQAFTITTLQKISGGAQVYDSYGQKCNHRFLLNYGFAVEE